MIFDRQKIVGWIMVIACGGYLLYFWQIKVMSPGPRLTRMDWFNLITALMCLFIGIINVRLAAARTRNRPPSE